MPVQNLKWSFDRVGVTCVVCIVCARVVGALLLGDFIDRSCMRQEDVWTSLSHSPISLVPRTCSTLVILWIFPLFRVCGRRDQDGLNFTVYCCDTRMNDRTGCGHAKPDRSSSSPSLLIDKRISTSCKIGMSFFEKCPRRIYHPHKPVYLES